MSIRILLVDDQDLLVEGLRALIESQPNMNVIAEARNGRSAVELAAKLSPDIILMDVSMPDLNGIEATRQILARRVDAKIIALSGHCDRRLVLAMLEAGAKGYLLKVCAFKELIHAIRTVAANSTYLSQQITDLVINDFVHRIPQHELSPLSLLTSREREVLQLLAEGKGTKEIASLLKISVKTIETYRQQIMTKLDVRSIAELTKFAIREGLTSL